MFRFAILLSLLLFTVSFGRAQEEFGYLCVGVLPIEAPPDIPLDFQYLHFDSGLDGSGGDVTLLNKSNKGIRYYVAIMEFVDDKGNYLISAPVYNVDHEDQTIPLDVPFKPWLLRNWPGGHMTPIAAKSSSHETFNSAFAMLTCPASARVAMVQLRYDDGTEFKYVSPSLRISAASSQRLEISDLETARRWSPITVSGTLEIDSAGHARILELNAAPSEFGRWLKKEFAHWAFTPAWADGKPVSVQFPFVFFLGESTHSWVQVEVMRKKGARGPMLVWPSFN